MVTDDELVKLLLKDFKLMDTVTLLYEGKNKFVPNYLTFQIQCTLSYLSEKQYLI